MKSIKIGKIGLGKRKKDIENMDISESNREKATVKGSSEDDTSNVKSNEESTKPKTAKEEIAELLKPIAIHEAKSAFYKAKLAKVVLSKGATVAAKTSKKAYESFKNKKSSK